MKKRFTEEQIIGVLKEAEAGAKPAELCRKHGISEATYYNWKVKFGGMTVSEAQRSKELERLHVTADLHIDQLTDYSQELAHHPIAMCIVFLAYFNCVECRVCCP